MKWNLKCPRFAILITVGPEDRYRSADGSGNNPLWPDLGKAGSPYSRSVPPVQPKAAAMPDPELVFDQLLKRDSFKPHPSGLNRLFFSFATVVIHECFQTSRKNPWINETSSYVRNMNQTLTAQSPANLVRQTDRH